MVQRVLDYGLMNDWQLLRKHLSIEEIAEIAQGLRNLDPLSMNFIAVISGKKPESFRCYSTKPFYQSE